MENLQYPIGRYKPQPYSESLKREYLIDIAQLPAMVEAAISNLDAAQLDTPYRPGGWTVAQVVHHLADSHINGYARVKLTLTEKKPVICSYNENAWVQQADAQQLPINNATTLLHALHQRLYLLFKSVANAEWQRPYIHPDSGEHTLWNLLCLYAWHGKHHVAHINSLRQQMGWY
jgi:uncharacterized damage-inducible protein DinB